VDHAPTQESQSRRSFARRRPAVLSRPPARASWLSGWALLPLRAFLGVTFCVAAIQKLANPNFFKSSDPAGIYAQLLAAERFSPLHLLLGHLLRFSTPLGLIIALGELAVGLGTVLGVFSRVAAFGGAVISLSLFLTVSWATSPYYTGADIAFLFAWTPLIVAGSGGVLSVDAWIADRVRAERGAGPATPVAVPFALVQRMCGQFEAGRCKGMRGAPCESGPCPFLRNVADALPEAERGDLTRRELLLGAAAAGTTGIAGLVAAGMAAGIGRAIGGAKPPPAAVSLSPTKSTTTTAAAGGSTSTTAAAKTPPGTAIGPAKDVPVGSWAAFTDPKTHLPSLVIQLDAGRFVAYDAVCPHEGCTVAYVPSESIIACPCHGSEFNPDTGSVIQGPAPHGLGRLRIAEGSDGQLYVSG
jgi:thiosulfate dehydrogenase (quinone) large subunit